MNIVTLTLTSEMIALQHIAKVRTCTSRPKVSFSTGPFSDAQVSFKKSYRTGHMELDSVSVGFDTSYMFSVRKFSELSQEKLMYVGAAMLKLGLNALAWDGIVVSLQDNPNMIATRELYTERTVIVERPVVVERRQETTTVRRTVITSHNPEMDAAVAIGAAVGAGLGLLGSILRNR